MTVRVFVRSMLLGGLATALAAGAAPEARAEGEMFKNLLGTMGIIPRDRDAIQYRERAPLVVPPKAELRTPSASAAAGNPNWPSDPEVVASRRAAEDARIPQTQRQSYRMNERDTRLSPAELAAGRSASAEAHDPVAHRGGWQNTLLSPLELLTGTSPSQEGAAAAAEEPRRRALTDPPSGMRRQTNANVRSATAPKVDQDQQNSAMNWLTSRFGGGGDDD